jgi:tRNA nucleotidyltransferase (CCA-adding enzyme)
MRIALAQRLPAEHAARLADIGRIAAQLRVPAYLVGGPVRDVLLCRVSLDVDVMVEGDAASLAQALAGHFHGRLTTHDRFGTAVVELPGWHVDVATARRERYPVPGVLPVVEPAPPAEDLQRRDFSINAMALRLDQDLGLLMDPFGGAADLRAGVVRGLHEQTFRDDPTRAVRAARYCARYGCRLDPATRGWLAAALEGGALATVTTQRHWGELSRLLTEATAPEAVDLLASWGVLGLLGLTHATSQELRLLHVAGAVLGGATATDRALAALGLLAGPAMPALTAAYSLSAGEAGASLAAAEAVAEPPAALFAAGPKSSTLWDVLSALPPAALLALWARHGATRLALQRFRELPVGLEITGHDLEAAGYAPSAGFRVALDAARQAMLDRAAERDGQLAVARQALDAWQAQHEL